MMNQKKYEEFKDKAINSNVVRKIISLSDVVLVSDRLIEYAGTQFEITEEAFKNLVTLCGLSNAQLHKITAQLGDRASQQLLNMMKIALSSNPDKSNLCMIINKSSVKVVAFVKSAESMLSNTAYFKLFEDVMNNNPSMRIKNMAVSEHGNIEISVINDNWQFNVAGLNDEFFNAGIAFINTPTQTIINPFNERLTCTNGMVVSQPGMALVLKNSSAESINGFYDTVRNLKQNLNFEVEFKKRIIRMMETQSSLAELKDVRKSVEYHVANITDPEVRVTIESFIPLIEVERAFLANKINLLDVDTKHYKRIRTPFTVWDLVNRLTDLSSHPEQYGLYLKSGNSSVFDLQKKAGELSFKDMYDLENPIKQIF